MSKRVSSSSLMSCISELQPQLLQARKLWLAYSGGLDSTVLLHLLKTSGFDISLIHINHQLSINANAWEEHCRSFANYYGCEFFVERVDLIPGQGGLESAAREKRYEVFRKYVQENDLLLFGHHADDQLETLIYRMMRGTGVKGLAGIPKARPLSTEGKSEKTILRPLLNISRLTLMKYAEQNHLNWVEDESNEQLAFDRNFIRHRIIPSLKERWPDAALQVVNVATLLGEMQNLLETYADEDLIRCGRRRERIGESIDLLVFKRLDKSRQNHILRTWVADLGFLAPNRTHLLELDLLINAKADARPELSWGECSLHRYQNRLYLHSRLPEIKAVEREWHGQDLTLAYGFLRSSEGKPGLLPGHYRVFYRHGGERCKPHNRKCSQALKKLLQEYNVEPWLRDYVPVIYDGEKIAAVGDVFICDGYTSENGWRLHWVI